MVRACLVTVAPAVTPKDKRAQAPDLRERYALGVDTPRVSDYSVTYGRRVTATDGAPPDGLDRDRTQGSDP